MQAAPISEEKIFEHIGRKDVELMALREALATQGRTLQENAAAIEKQKKEIERLSKLPKKNSKKKQPNGK